MEWSLGPFSLSVPPSDAWAFYLYIVIVGFIIRYFLVMRPTIELIRRYNPEIRSIIRALLSIKNAFGLKGIESFLAREIGTLLLPGLAALTIRIVLGNPTDVDWTDMRMYLMIGFAGLWIVAEIYRSMSTRKKVKQLIEMNLPPSVVKNGLGALRWTRSALGVVATMDITEEPEENAVDVVKNHAKSLFKNPLKLNPFHTAKAAVKTVGAAARDIASLAVDKVDSQAQKIVDQQIKFDLQAFVVDMVMSIFPLVVIYALVPILP